MLNELSKNNYYSYRNIIIKNIKIFRIKIRSDSFLLKIVKSLLKFYLGIFHKFYLNLNISIIIPYNKSNYLNGLIVYFLLLLTSLRAFSCPEALRTSNAVPLP